MAKAAVVAQVEPRLIERIRRDPDLIEDVACDCLQRALDTRMPRDAAAPEAVHLGADWHALHYVLTGEREASDSALSCAILGGSPVGRELPWGSARALEPGRVREVARALAAVQPDALKARFDLDAQVDADLYRVCDDPERLAALLRRLQRCYLGAAARGRAMMLFHSVSTPVLI